MQLFADITKLILVHTVDINARMFFDGINHGDTFKRRFERNGFIAQLNFSSAINIQTDFLHHILGEFHHPVIVLVSHVNFHGGKFGVVRTVHTFVTKVFRKLIHSFKTSYNKPFQV